ncbi:MAG: hypothetical protein ABII07_01985 [Patescibacteria group bacterium]|nr:hypothetical protein [Patescibacteria group bacterium]
MKKLLTGLVITSLLFISGCNAQYFTDLWNSFTKETGEAYENIKTEVTEKTDAIKDKIEDVNQAAEDVSEAADAIGEAVDSLQSIGGDKEEETETATGTTTE